MKHDTRFGLLTGNDIDARFFKADDVVFREGDEAKELFVIKSGQVRVQIGNRTVTELAADSIFGEMALIDSEPRSATARAAPESYEQTFWLETVWHPANCNNSVVWQT